VTVVEVIGWVATVSGTILGLPQVLRLVRTGRVEGLSLTAWQAMLVVNVSWTAHGISIGQVPQILTSALSLCSTVPILYLMARELQRHLLPVLLPGLLAAGALIAVDQIFGSAAYGTMAIIPAVVSNAGQSIELVRSPHIVGVSVLFLMPALRSRTAPSHQRQSQSPPPAERRGRLPTPEKTISKEHTCPTRTEASTARSRL
jgi:uncharacterized protein with PQ loop repeat